MDLVQHLETGKFGTFIASIQTQGLGLLHLVEDLETGFLKAEPSLDKYRVVTQEIIDDAAKAADNIKTVTSDDPNSTQVEAVTTPAQPEPVPVPVNVSAQAAGAWGPDTPLAS